jgi:hypothetical protein
MRAALPLVCAAAPARQLVRALQAGEAPIVKRLTTIPAQPDGKTRGFMGRYGLELVSDTLRPPLPPLFKLRHIASPCPTEQEDTSTDPPQEMLSIPIVTINVKRNRVVRRNI